MTAGSCCNSRNDAKVLDEIVVFSERAATTTGSSARLKRGERLPVRELLYGLLLPSGNDAAVALAEHFSPRFRSEKANGDSVGPFVAEMNRRAKSLKMGETNYQDPNGLSSKNQSSARNLATLAWHALQNKQMRRYVQTRRHQYDVEGPDGEKRPVTWDNTNRLLDIESYDGVKTGTTNAAGNCLVASGHRGSDHLIVVVLGSTAADGRYVDAGIVQGRGMNESPRGCRIGNSALNLNTLAPPCHPNVASSPACWGRAHRNGPHAAIAK